MPSKIRLFHAFAVLIFILYTPGYEAMAQGPCPEFMEISRGDRVRIVMSYEAESMQLNFFPNQKGVAMMEITRNNDGEEVWSLYIEIDDRYKDLPINKYSMMGHMLILITEKSAPSFSTDSLVRQERNRCLEKIVGSRLYQRNDRSDDVSVAYTPAGKVIWEKPGIPKMKPRGMRIMGGNEKNQTIITFKRDGTYTLQKPV